MSTRSLEVATRDWHRVGQAIQRRIDELGTSQRHVADKAGVSTSLLNELVHARRVNYSPASLIAVSKALGWPSDTLEEIAEGGEPPEEVEPSAMAQALGESLRQLAEIGERLSLLAQRIEAQDQRFDEIARRLDALEP